MLYEIQGMEIISLAEGKALGRVQKVYLNPIQKTVSGIQVRPGGIGGQVSWVDICNVSKIGEDVVFVNQASACKSNPPVGRSLKDMMGMPVAGRDGKLLGSLVDMEVDAQWRVEELSLSEGRMVSITPDSTVFGQDTILLESGAFDRIRSSSRKKVGFLARIFGAQIIQEAASAISRAERAQKKPSQQEKNVEESISQKKAEFRERARAHTPNAKKKSSQKRTRSTKVRGQSSKVKTHN